MKYETYNEIEAYPDNITFDFISDGCNGKIPKRVEFLPTQWSNVYNLAFGDIDENGNLDDLTISNNGDRNKILATILKIVDGYTYKFPDRFIYFKGSTEHRTRLYRMAVSLNLEELSTNFEIYADHTGSWEFVRFEKGMNVKAFVVKRKNIKFVI